MERISASQWQRLAHANAAAAEFTDLDSFRAGISSLVKELVTCDITAYNEIRPGATAIVFADPVVTLAPEDELMLATLALQNPLVAHFVSTGDGRALRFSDFITRRQLHHLDLYDLVYRRLATEYQVAFVLPAPPGEVVGITLNRARRDFTRQEVTLLELIRAPLRASYARLVELAELHRVVRALDAPDDCFTRAALLVDSDGSIVRWTASAAILLGGVESGPAPEPLLDWLRRPPVGGGQSSAPLVFERDGRRLRATLHVDGPGAPRAVTLTEARSQPTRAQLRHLALSPRETDVLHALMGGASNPQMARDLGMSTRTVEKHLQHIYTRLGVTTRTAAIHRAHQGGAVD
jgi:DNA-binding CsgD family transcriptional regulator